MTQQSLGRSLRIATSGAYGRYILIRLHHIALSREHQHFVSISHYEPSFQAAQHAISTPFFGQFYCRPPELPSILLQHTLEPLKQGQRISHRASKSGDHLVVIESTHLLGTAFQHNISSGNLTISSYGHLVTPSNRQNCGPPDAFRHHSLPSHQFNRINQKLTQSPTTSRAPSPLARTGCHVEPPADRSLRAAPILPLLPSPSYPIPLP